MPGIEERLGLEGEAEQPETEGTESPLKKISDAKRKDEKGDSKAKLDESALLEMMMAGENSEGMTTELDVPDEEDGVKKHEDAEESPKIESGTAESKGKYKDLFETDMFRHPDKYFIETPEGRMTIAEAMRRGYNPITRNFDDARSRRRIMEDAEAGLNESDRETVERMMDPRAAKVAPADAEGFGLEQDSPMVARPQGEPETPQAPEGSPQPIGAQAMPEGEATAQQQGNPLAALLGGNAQ